MYPLMIGFRHTHPAMSKIENQFPDYGLSQGENAKNSLRIFDKILFENEYVAGQRFTYADIQMAVSLQFLVGLNKIELSEYKALDAYIEMINARPSFNKP
jgi:glutathione S-transferase